MFGKKKVPKDKLRDDFKITVGEIVRQAKELKELEEACDAKVTEWDYYDAVCAAVLDCFPEVANHPKVVEFNKRVEAYKKGKEAKPT